MTVVLHDANTIRLIGACPAEDGETLLQELVAIVFKRGCSQFRVLLNLGWDSKRISTPTGKSVRTTSSAG